jgi:hypothetical protein
VHMWHRLPRRSAILWCAPPLLLSVVCSAAATQCGVLRRCYSVWCAPPLLLSVVCSAAATQSPLSRHGATTVSLSHLNGQGE